MLCRAGEETLLRAVTGDQAPLWPPWGVSLTHAAPEGSPPRPHPQQRGWGSMHPSFQTPALGLYWKRCGWYVVCPLPPPVGCQRHPILLWQLWGCTAQWPFQREAVTGGAVSHRPPAAALAWSGPGGLMDPLWAGASRCWPRTPHHRTTGGPPTFLAFLACLP